MEYIFRPLINQPVYNNNKCSDTGWGETLIVCSHVVSQYKTKVNKMPSNPSPLSNFKTLKATRNSNNEHK
jgi:hypothetical protein